MTATQTTRKPSTRTPRPNLKAVPAPATPAAATPAPKPAAPAPKPAATPVPGKPAATFDLGATQVTVWFPSTKLASGETVKCPHGRYGHETEKAAAACIKSVIASKGHRAVA